jgi:hypothetical protein
MKTLTAMRTSQIGKFARFLDEHPGFSPELVGENADVYGFRVGESLLSVDEMERLIDTSVLCRRRDLGTEVRRLRAGRRHVQAGEAMRLARFTAVRVRMDSVRFRPSAKC